MAPARSALGAALFDNIRRAGPTRDDALRRMDMAAHFLDTSITIPGIRRRVGFDAIIGLVPGIGDLAATLLSSYIIWEARGLGLPRWVIARMMGNVAINGVVGMVPLAGDAFSAIYRSNRRNMRIVRDYLAKHEPELVRDASRGVAPGVIDADYVVVDLEAGR